MTPLLVDRATCRHCGIPIWRCPAVRPGWHTVAWGGEIADYCDGAVSDGTVRYRHEPEVTW
jgi:hypothetical protein